MFRALLDTCVLFFPAAVTARYDIDVVDQDGFLLDQWDLDSVAVRRALTRQVWRYSREPRTVEDLLIALGRQARGCPRFATLRHKTLYNAASTRVVKRQHSVGRSSDCCC